MTIASAVILAAGRGSRLQAMTDDKPKCLVLVHQRPILFWMLDNLAQAGLSRVFIVVGYRHEAIEKAVGFQWRQMSIVYIFNEHWDTANNIVSLQKINDHIDEDFLLIEGDIVISRAAIKKLLVHRPSAKIISDSYTNGNEDKKQKTINLLAMDAYQEFMDGTVVSILPSKKIDKIFLKNSPDRPQDLSGLYKTVNIYQIGIDDYRRYIIKALDQLIIAGLTDQYYELAFAQTVNNGQLEFQGVDFSGIPWFEIDDIQDLQRSQKTLAPELL